MSSWMSSRSSFMCYTVPSAIGFACIVMSVSLHSFNGLKFFSFTGSFSSSSSVSKPSMTLSKRNRSRIVFTIQLVNLINNFNYLGYVGHNFIFFDQKFQKYSKLSKGLRVRSKLKCLSWDPWICHSIPWSLNIWECPLPIIMFSLKV